MVSKNLLRHCCTEIIFVYLYRIVDATTNRYTKGIRRNQWRPNEPRLIGEGLEAWGYVFVFIRLLGLMRVDRHLGKPWQCASQRYANLLRHRTSANFTRKNDGGRHSISFHVRFGVGGVCIRSY